MSETGTKAQALKPPASARTVAILRAVVIGLGVLLVIAFVVLVGQILYLLFAKPAQPPSRPAITREAAEAAVALPAGSSIKGISVSGDRLAIHIVGPTGDSIVVLDAVTGAVVSRLKVVPSGQ